jgi:CRP/FNR family transcriptional regulator
MDSILQHCSDEWNEFIEFHSTKKTFKKNDHIFDAGDKTEGLFVINKGKAKVLYKEYDGDQRLIRLAKDGDILGHRGFGGTWAYTISAIALCETELTFIPMNILDIVMKTNPCFTYQLLIFFAEELRKSEAKIKRYPAKNLMARAILENQKIFGFENEKSTKLSYTLSRTDYANMIGKTYETVVRTLAELDKDGIIKIDKKALHITDMDALRDLARAQYKS